MYKNQTDLIDKTFHYCRSQFSALQLSDNPFYSGSRSESGQR